MEKATGFNPVAFVVAGQQGFKSPGHKWQRPQALPPAAVMVAGARNQRYLQLWCGAA